MKKQLTTILSVSVAFVALLIVWSIAAYWFHPGYVLDENGAPVLEDGKPRVNGIVLLPSPVVVVIDLYILIAEQGFLKDIFASSSRVFLGLCASVIPAFILGVWFGVSPRVREAVTPVFAFIQYIPPVAFVPLLILWLGIGLSQQVALLFIGTFFYLTIMIAVTVANTPAAFHDAALTLGARPYQLIWKVIIPYGLPEFLQHLRVMVGVAWTYLTVVEMVSAQNGIGSVIINSGRYLQTSRVLAGLITIGFMGILCDFLLLRASRFLCKWKV